MNRSPARLLGAGAALGVALALLHAAGGALPTTPSLADPALLVVAGLRYVALAAGWYLAAVLAVGVVARVGRLRLLARAADAFTVPALRRLLDLSLGLSVVAMAPGPSAAWADAATDRPVVTIVRLPDERPPPSSTTATTATVDAPPLPVPTPVSHAPPTPTPTPTPAAPQQWTVQAGDHFWSIAERVLAGAWARAPDDAEIDPYWRRLVEANRDRLADRDNPDLLFVGQVLVVPSP